MGGRAGGTHTAIEQYLLSLFLSLFLSLSLFSFDDDAGADARDGMVMMVRTMAKVVPLS